MEDRQPESSSLWGQGCAHQVHLDLALRVKLEMAVSLEAALDELPELGGEAGIVEMVDSETGPGRLGRVRGPDALLRGADGRAAELNLLETVHDLVEAEDEVGSVRDEQAVGTCQACTVCQQLPKEERVGLYLPFRSRVSSSLKSAGTLTTTPEPMKAVHVGLIRPVHQVSDACMKTMRGTDR